MTSPLMGTRLSSSDSFTRIHSPRLPGTPSFLRAPPSSSFSFTSTPSSSSAAAGGTAAAPAFQAASYGGRVGRGQGGAGGGRRGGGGGPGRGRGGGGGAVYHADGTVAYRRRGGKYPMTAVYSGLAVNTGGTTGAENGGTEPLIPSPARVDSATPAARTPPSKGWKKAAKNGIPYVCVDGEIAEKTRRHTSHSASVSPKEADDTSSPTERRPRIVETEYQRKPGVVLPPAPPVAAATPKSRPRGRDGAATPLSGGADESASRRRRSSYRSRIVCDSDDDGGGDALSPTARRPGSRRGSLLLRPGPPFEPYTADTLDVENDDWAAHPVSRGGERGTGDIDAAAVRQAENANGNGSLSEEQPRAKTTKMSTATPDGLRHEKSSSTTSSPAASSSSAAGGSLAPVPHPVEEASALAALQPTVYRAQGASYFVPVKDTSTIAALQAYRDRTDDAIHSYQYVVNRPARDAFLASLDWRRPGLVIPDAYFLPTTLDELVGTPTTLQSIRRLDGWLDEWDAFYTGRSAEPPEYCIAFIKGPSGSGKRVATRLALQKHRYQIISFDVSLTRSSVLLDKHVLPVLMNASYYPSTSTHVTRTALVLDQFDAVQSGGGGGGGGGGGSGGDGERGGLISFLQSRGLVREMVGPEDRAVAQWIPTMSGSDRWWDEQESPHTAGPHPASAGVAGTHWLRTYHRQPRGVVYTNAVHDNTVSFRSNGWLVGDFVEIRTTTQVCRNVTLTFRQRSSGDGPRRFEVVAVVPAGAGPVGAAAVAAATDDSGAVGVVLGTYVVPSVAEASLSSPSSLFTFTSTDARVVGQSSLSIRLRCTDAGSGASVGGRGYTELSHVALRIRGWKRTRFVSPCPIVLVTNEYQFQYFLRAVQNSTLHLPFYHANFKTIAERLYHRISEQWKILWSKDRTAASSIGERLANMACGDIRKAVSMLVSAIRCAYVDKQQRLRTLDPSSIEYRRLDTDELHVRQRHCAAFLCLQVAAPRSIFQQCSYLVRHCPDPVHAIQGVIRHRVPGVPDMFYENYVSLCPIPPPTSSAFAPTGGAPLPSSTVPSSAVVTAAPSLKRPAPGAGTADGTAVSTAVVSSTIANAAAYIGLLSDTASVFSRAERYRFLFDYVRNDTTQSLYHNEVVLGVCYLVRGSVPLETEFWQRVTRHQPFPETTTAAGGSTWTTNAHVDHARKRLRFDAETTLQAPQPSSSQRRGDARHDGAVSMEITPHQEQKPASDSTTTSATASSPAAATSTSSSLAQAPAANDSDGTEWVRVVGHLQRHNLHSLSLEKASNDGNRGIRAQWHQMVVKERDEYIRTTLPRLRVRRQTSTNVFLYYSNYATSMQHTRRQGSMIFHLKPTSTVEVWESRPSPYAAAEMSPSLYGSPMAAAAATAARTPSTGSRSWSTAASPPASCRS